MTRRRDRDDAFGSQCPRHVRGALYFQKSFCHTRAWCTRRNAPPFIERSFDNSAQLSGHEAGIVPLTGGSRRVKTFQRTQFFENIERDYNEVKKLEIKVCNNRIRVFSSCEKGLQFQIGKRVLIKRQGYHCEMESNSRIDSFREREQERTEDA